MDKARILVVEDESLLAEDIQERLKNLGYEVAAVAHSGEEALARVAAAQPDLVLMDIRLKGKMDGLDTARVVRERFNLPIVYLTGDADTATLERAKATEPLGYLLKPVDEKRLHSTVTGLKQAEKELTDSREQLRALAAYLQTVREEERTRIAREVHDELGQALTGLKMDLAWLEKKLAEASHLPSLRTVRKMTRHMPEVVDEIISAIRKIATELRPGVLDDLGLRIPLARSGETTST